MENSIAELENAANLFMGAPGETSAEQRRNAETVIMNFRKTKSPYQLCREILEKTQVDILRFEAADMLKQAIVVEWDSLEDQYKLSLRQYLLNYILNQNVQPFVREKILQVVAIMIKRSSILDAGVERGCILDEAQKMISSGDISQQYLACRIVYNIMQEYSTTIKSDDTGLTFNEHFKAKKQFELIDLRKIFVMIFDALVAIMKIIDLTNPTHAHLLLEYFTIHEQVLMWGYVSPLLSKRLVGIFETINKTDQCPSLRLTLPWERIILDPRVVEVFFGIYWKVRDLPQIQPKSLTCIVQLSTLNGPVLNNQENKLKYVTNFLTHFLQLTSSIRVKATEANGFATVLRRVLLYNLPNIFKDISDELRNLLLQQMFVLTCNFIESSIHEDTDCLSESIYTDALDVILEAWLLIIQGKEHFQTELLKQFAIQIFNKYLQCHLSPPDGLRKQNQSSSDMDDIEQSDRDRYKEQLIIIGALGREEPAHSLAILCKLLEEKTRCLQAHLERIYTNSANLNISSTDGLEQLYEDILWIILVSAHVLSMESVGEQPLIPSEIMHYSKQQMLNGQTDLTMSLKVLALEAPIADDACDNVLRLIAAAFRLCDIETKAMEANMKSVLSPEITSNLMWFLQMWAESYLLYLGEYYTDVSEVFKTAFGVETPGANWIVGFLLNKICVNVRHFYSEQQVVQDSIQLFVSLVKRKQKCPVVFNSEYFKQIVQLKDLNIPKQSLLKGLVVTGSCITNKALQQQYLLEILSPIDSNYKKLNPINNYSNNIDINTASIETVAILDEIRACFMGATSQTAVQIYSSFDGTLFTMSHLLRRYRECQTVAVAVLELMCELFQVLIYLPNHQAYEICMDVVDTYVCDRSNRVSVATTAEDDTFEDIMLLLKLMTLILSNNIYNIMGVSEEPQQKENFCVQIFNRIIPIIKLEMLNYPTLCINYYKAITFFVDTRGYKLRLVPDDLISSILKSIEIGLFQFGAEVQVVCFEFLQAFGTFIHLEQNNTSFTYQTTMQFIGIVVEMILNQDLSSDNKNECSKALFSLICAYKDRYGQILQQIIQARSNSEHAERLSKEFQELTRGIDLVVNRTNQNMFIERFEKFIMMKTNNILNIYMSAVAFPMFQR